MLDDQRDKEKRIKDWTREWRQGSTQVKAGKNLSVSWVSIGHVWCNRSYQYSGLTISHPFHRHSASLSQQHASPNLLRPPVSAHIPSGKFRDYKQEVPKVGNRYQKVVYWHQQLVTWDTGISRASPREWWPLKGACENSLWKQTHGWTVFLSVCLTTIEPLIHFGSACDPALMGHVMGPHP